jgi:protein involved in sex pheromone biosynthesis
MMKRNVGIIAVAGLLILLSGCAPEVGSKEWCDSLDEKPKGDWSTNEATDYATHCLFKSKDEE